ncbi:MAG: hypothetical protein K6B68_10865 [Eubacterium sp.]|nr:hypothetical protein [Eubacterium sp.]
MIKRIIFGSLLFIITFIGAALSFNYINNRQKNSRTVEGFNPTMPKAYIMYEGVKINSILGYKDQIDTSLYRDSIVPMDSSKTVNIILADSIDTGADIKYELRSFDGSNLIEEGDFRFVSTDLGYSEYCASFRMNLSIGTEYSLVIKVIRQKDTISYYTRVVRLNDCRLDDFLTFSTNFSDKIYEENKLFNQTATSTDAVTTFNVSGEQAEIRNSKKNQEKTTSGYATTTDALASYTEVNIGNYFSSADAMSSLYNAEESVVVTSDGNPGYVTLNSSYEDVIFTGMSIERLSEVIPKVREVSRDSAIIELRYKAISEVNGIGVTYAVSEYLTMEYDNGAAAIKLHDYRRYLNQDFRAERITSLSNSINLGITYEREPKYLTNKNNKKVAFIADNSLWLYDNTRSIYSSVYGTSTDEAEKERFPQEGYDIMLLNMDSDVLDFAVYGRINEGPREGRNGVLLYEYNIQDSTLKELCFISSNLYYETMKLSVGRLCYYDKTNRAFYCLMGQNLLHVDIFSGQVETQVDSLTSDEILVSENMKVIAYPDKADRLNVEAVTVRDFESGKETTLKRKGKNLSILGFIGNDVMYGTADKENISRAVDGTPQFLFEQLYIVDSSGSVLKKYDKEGMLVSNVEFKENNIYLTRVRKNEETGAFEEAQGDYISYKPSENDDTMKVVVSKNEAGNEELHLKFPDSVYVMSGNEEIFTRVSSSNNEIDVRNESDIDRTAAYIFEPAGLETSSISVGKAVRYVYDEGGFVVNTNGDTMYMVKQMRPYLTVAGSFPYKAVDNEADTLAACNYMCILAAGISADYDEVRSKGNWEESFEMYSSDVRGINISGVKMDTAIGYLSDGSPFAARIGDRYVLVVSYNDDYIRYYDPIEDKEIKLERYRFQMQVNEKDNEFYTFVR